MVIRVLRGGSWNNKPNNLRCANRNRNNPDNRNNNNGFRCVKSLKCLNSAVHGWLKRAVFESRAFLLCLKQTE